MNRLFKNKTKTIALLIYIRSTLEQLFILIDNKEYALKLLSKEDNKIILNNLEELLNKLKDSSVMNDATFRNNMENSKSFAAHNQELVYYYNSIVKKIEENMKNGDLWIPEQFILSLLSEWLIEEKHTQFFPYLANIDYLELLSKFETVDFDKSKDYRKKVTQMYIISSQVINILKKIRYQAIIKKSVKKPSKRNSKKKR